MVPLSVPEVRKLLLRLVWNRLIPLVCGTILNFGVCRYGGKGQGEVSLLRKLWDMLRPSDLLLTDRLQVN